MSTHGIMIGQAVRGPIFAPRGAAVGASQIDRHIAANFYPTPPEATLALLSVESFDGYSVAAKIDAAIADATPAGQEVRS